MKKITAVILSLTLLFAFAACNGGADDLRQNYGLAVQNGYDGTYDEWLSFIKDPDGGSKPAYKIYDILGTAPASPYYPTQGSWNGVLAWREKSKSLAERYRGSVLSNLDPADNAVYLTFDDGPDPVNTVKVMNTLMEYNAEATFFFQGQAMNNNKEVVKQVFDNGFPIGLHSVRHESYLTMNDAQLIGDLTSANDTLESITGSRTRAMRPPYGDLGEEQVGVVSGLGLRTHLWSLDVLDWAQDDPKDIVRNVKENVRPGDVILAHAYSGQPRTPVALPEILRFLQEQGYQIKALPNVNYVPEEVDQDTRMQAFGDWQERVKAKLSDIIGVGAAVGSIDGLDITDSLNPGKSVFTVFAGYRADGRDYAGSIRFEADTPVTADMQTKLAVIESIMTVKNVILGSVQFAAIGDTQNPYIVNLKNNGKTTGGIKDVTIKRQLTGFATAIASAGGAATYQVRGLIEAGDGDFYDLVYTVVNPVNDSRPGAQIYTDLGLISNEILKITQNKWQRMSGTAEFDALKTEYDNYNR